MSSIFPLPITDLPRADIPLPGCTAHLSQGETHQILFMEFAEETLLPEHCHEAQVGFVLRGRIDLVIHGKEHTFTEGDRYYIPAGVLHSGKIHAGYADITFFDEKNRYSQIQPE
ncbi:cupin domain-containing protein [Desulfosediminicola flagellatus]|uniref:cupin domain-containing protein n=1 Tax=Desulfosediminicola flagellatus TaxID=2569541 RepID=UPI0010AC5350|nr:cupin domain-containing protein [Desulfosediminicola flagellatus]